MEVKYHHAVDVLHIRFSVFLKDNASLTARK
jgi:hypothetical protein